MTEPWPSVLYAFTETVHSGILGALLIFAPRLRWYPIYEARTRAMVLAVSAMVVGMSTGCGPDVRSHAAAVTGGGDSERGRELIRTYGCGSCHLVPGVPAAEGVVGPPLAGIGSRSMLAGQLPNTPENMMRWIRDPQEVEAGTAMPDLYVGERDARDLAAYLYTLQ